MAPEAFGIEGYFEAYIKYVEDRHQARTEGHDPELVEFHPPAAIEGGLEDEETLPLDDKASSPQPEATKLRPPKVVTMMTEGSDHDENLDI